MSVADGVGDVGQFPAFETRLVEMDAICGHFLSLLTRRPAL
jgi:hypothetical protein